jgi:hypothetical protein
MVFLTGYTVMAGRQTATIKFPAMKYLVAAAQLVG